MAGTVPGACSGLAPRNVEEVTRQGLEPAPTPNPPTEAKPVSVQHRNLPTVIHKAAQVISFRIYLY